MNDIDKTFPSAVEQFGAMVASGTEPEEGTFHKAMQEIVNPDIQAAPPPEIIREWRAGENDQPGADPAAVAGIDELHDWKRLYAFRDGFTLTEAAIIIAGYNPEDPLFSWQEKDCQEYAALLQQAVVLHKIWVLPAVNKDDEFVWMSHKHIRRWCEEKGFHWPLPLPAAPTSSGNVDPEIKKLCDYVAETVARIEAWHIENGKPFDRMRMPGNAGDLLWLMQERHPEKFGEMKLETFPDHYARPKPKICGWPRYAPPGARSLYLEIFPELKRYQDTVVHIRK